MNGRFGGINRQAIQQLAASFVTGQPHGVLSPAQQAAIAQLLGR